jgi:flagellar basal-body rod modification protein FlgD
MVTTAVTSATTTPATTTTSKASIDSDFDTFLKMMTVQMKNQDPLNPVDSADYAMQLATFSGVEQQIKTNTLLEGLNSQFSVLGMAQLAAWVGQEARSSAPVAYSGAPVTISYSAAATADRAVLVVKDNDGAVVAREDVPVATGAYQWLGGDAAGNALPSGFYSLSLENYKGDQQLGNASPVESYARIVEARSGANGATLVLAGGIEMPATEITALRVP